MAETNLPAAVQLRADVKTSVAEQQNNGEVRKRVIAQLAEAEIVKRTDLLAKAIAKREEQSKTIDKIRPDMVSYSDTGTVVAEHYSKAKADELKKARELLGKIDKAIDKAVNTADYEEVRKVVGGGGEGQEQKSE